MKYITIDNAKTTKGESSGYLTGILYLAPANEAKQAGFNVPNACPFASAGCKAACLFTAGRGAFSNVREARIRKSVELMGGKKWNEAPDAPRLEELAADIAALVRKAKLEKKRPAVRLNGTSDYPVENWGLMEMFKSVQFYDYTKDHKKYLDYLEGKLPKNYHLTFSRSENNGDTALDILRAGGQVAVVYKELQNAIDYARKAGVNVIDGDANDLTFKAGAGVLALRAKGKAKKDVSGFVI